MAWTYDPTNLDESTAEGRKNVVRLLIGDTNENDQQMQDEEIFFALESNNDDVYLAAIWCCSTLSAQYARKVNSEIEGTLKAEYSDISKAYNTLGKTLTKTRNRLGGKLGSKFLGTKVSEVKSAREDTNRVPSDFQKGRFNIKP